MKQINKLKLTKSRQSQKAHDACTGRMWPTCFMYFYCREIDLLKHSLHIFFFLLLFNFLAHQGKRIHSQKHLSGNYSLHGKIWPFYNILSNNKISPLFNSQQIKMIGMSGNLFKKNVHINLSFIWIVDIPLLSRKVKLFIVLFFWTINSRLVIPKSQVKGKTYDFIKRILLWFWIINLTMIKQIKQNDESKLLKT